MVGEPYVLEFNLKFGSSEYVIWERSWRKANSSILSFEYDLLFSNLKLFW